MKKHNAFVLLFPAEQGIESKKIEVIVNFPDGKSRKGIPIYFHNIDTITPDYLKRVAESCL